ncbi:DNA-3-methyladenine glycosylase [Candidatus Saccharibacteria bacterium]|nr:DNA-3-methyladenine glycosylase [Candidatus Saccharibacteria bacterium]
MNDDRQDFSVLEGAAWQVAPRLIGCVLERELPEGTVRVRIVEAEAYDQTDVASHTFKGYSERSKTMFGPAGHLYVYLIYGMYYCCNIVAGKAGFGAGVLIRAVEPLEKVALLAARRPGVKGAALSNGPGKLCLALGIDRTMDGHDLRQPLMRLILQPPLPPASIVQTVRVGLSQGTETPWRFYERGNPYVSRPL